MLSRADIATHGAAQIREGEARSAAPGKLPLVISAATGQGIEALLDSCIELAGARPIARGEARPALEAVVSKSRQAEAASQTIAASS